MDIQGYEQRIQNEIRHYTSLLEGQTPSEDVVGVLPKVAVFEHALDLYRPYLSTRMAHLDLESYVVERQRRLNRPMKLVSLGCGAGDWEMRVAKRSKGNISVHLIDLSMDLLGKAAEVGRRDGLSVETTVQDVNEIDLRRDSYDFVLCRSSLHHFVRLERVLSCIRTALAKGGQFIIVGEWIGRNGLQVYPETERIAQEIFDRLPERFRFNQYTKVVDTVVPNIDHSIGSFEAIRSEHIMPLLLDNFTPYEHVTFDAFLSLLLDFRYGPNYDISQPEDRDIAEDIIQKDIECIRSGWLKPTAMFGIFQ